MTTYTLNAGEFAAQRKTLVADTVDTVTFAAGVDLQFVEVFSNGLADVYVRTDGTDPVVDDPNCHRIPAGAPTFRVIPVETDAPTSVKLISSSTPTYSVNGNTRAGLHIAGTPQNHAGVLLASAARTATQNLGPFTNWNHRGVLLILNVSAASGTGGLTTTVQFIDPVDDTSKQDIVAATAVTATGRKTYMFYPGSSSSGVTQNWSQPLPRRWACKVSVGDSSSYTYSLTYQLIL